MKLTLTRALIVFTAIAVPAAAGGMYVWSSRNCQSCGASAKSAAKRKPAPCSCCEVPGREELISALAEGDPGKSDSPMFGGTPQRNMVNLTDKNLPANWNPEDKTNIKWVADLGSKSYGGPVIAGGKIYVGTNNGNPRDPKIKEQRPVLMAFNEADGKFLWQITHITPPDETFKEGLPEGLCSTPIVEGDGIYYVTPGAEVICANPAGKIVWTYDMMKELKVLPFHLANCSPFIVDDLLMMITSNGVDEEGVVHSPKAPSFIAVNKKTGKLAWQSALPGENIVQGQWTNPTLAVVGGKKQAIFPGGDGVIYSLDPATGNLIWKFDCHPVRPKAGEKKVINYFVSTGVVEGDKFYIGMGVGPDLGETPKFSHVLCVDITKSGDVSPKSLDKNDPANKASALVWAFGGPINPRPKTGRSVLFASTISTCAVYDGLVYAAEQNGYLHCLDAKTGERYWEHDLQAAVWGSPYYVDGRILLGTEDGSIVVFGHGKKKNVIATIDHGEAILSTPVAANGVLYIMTRSKLIAVAEKK